MLTSFNYLPKFVPPRFNLDNLNNLNYLKALLYKRD